MDYTKFQNLVEKTYLIDKELYTTFDVKRGLRNSDGSGVIAGLTRISSVTGYKKKEDGIMPVEGQLQYRGYQITEIIDAIVKENRSGFEEITFLLLFGKLPSTTELEAFKKLLDEYIQLPDGFEEGLMQKSNSKDVMNKLAQGVLGLYSYDENPDMIEVLNNIEQSIKLIARFPTLLAYCYQAVAHYQGHKSMVIHEPVAGLGMAKNFLRLIRPQGKFTDLEARILDIALVLHAEHGGGNNSSFTSHVLTSSHTDVYSTIAAAIGSLKGPKHGGANLRVISMMEDFKTNVSNWEDKSQVSDHIIKILNKKAYDRTGLIYGTGHAVYTLSDPRAAILKEYAKELAIAKNREKEFKLYTIVEELTPSLFKEIKGTNKVISANVDFYSGFVYNMLEIPPELYTPIFAMSRVVGWCAHRIEEIMAGDRIIRPGFKSVEDQKEYKTLDKRR